MVNSCTYLVLILFLLTLNFLHFTSYLLPFSFVTISLITSQTSRIYLPISLLSLRVYPMDEKFLFSILLYKEKIYNRIAR